MKLVIATIFLAFGLNSFQQVKLVKTKVTDAITMSLPQEFIAMSQSEIIDRYVSAKTPAAAYTDYSRVVDLGLNITSSIWHEKDLHIMTSFNKSSIMQIYDNVQFLTEEIVEINGRDFLVFEFLASVTDEEGVTVRQQSISKFIRIQYAILNRKMVVFNFSCPVHLKEKWQPLAKEMMSTIKISKTL